MAYDFKPFSSKIAEIGERFARDLSSVRTGRAGPAILDGVQVEAYGTRMPINQLASVSVEDPRTLRVAPWNMGDIKEIERAIVAANLGISVGSDEKGVRIFFPELTGERREMLMKLAKEKLEEARKQLRLAREEVQSDIEKREKAKEYGEDDKFRYKEEMQKLVDAAGRGLEEQLRKKEQEIAN
jgi:ribosome recycling factor